MNKMGRILIAIGVLLSTSTLSVFAQEPLDGAYVKTTTKEKEAIPYDYVREADVFWAKRIWRIIDVREKMNLPFSYPQQPLADIIHTAAKNGELTVYDNSVVDPDQFKKVLSIDEVKKIGYSVDSGEVQTDEQGNEIKAPPVVKTFEPKQVVQYRVKEDWFFDEKNSVMIARIIGIAPVREYYDSKGTYLGVQTMYWVYYPDLRPILAKYEVFNPKNDAVRLSWEDMFEARMFESYIYKESNVYDRAVQDYATGIDGLLESDRIKNDIFVFEHDLWNY
jgi:gliding motility associated protien GldN